MRQIASGILLTLILAICAPSAVASIPEPMTSVFFDTVQKFYPEPDQVELARYLIYYPEHAAPVYSKAIEQDYIFIGILVAAKAARDQPIKGAGKFDYETCMIPTKTFDAVFMKSGPFVQTYSKNQFVKAYTEAKTEEARAEASAQLANNIPYLKEIPHLCHFTFNTNLQKEKEIKETITRGVNAFKRAYDGFASGNIVDGVGALISAGLNGDVACSLADQMISGGFIGKVPILGNLATSACAGFAGNVIKGVGAAGGAVVGAASNLGDAIAGQEKHMPTQAYYDLHWRPRVGEGAARFRAGTFGAFLKDMWEPCADYFDSHTMSRANAQETCDYHRDGIFVPAVNATIAAEDEVIRNREEITRQMPLWSNEFFQFWYPQCFDSACENKIKSLQDSANNYASSMKNNSRGGPGWPSIAGQLQSFHSSAAAEVEAAKQRFASINKATTQSASLAWEKLTRDVWTPRCWDKPCRIEIDQRAKDYGVATRLLQMAKPEESSLAIQGVVAREYAPKFQKSIDDSEGRRILADPKAEAIDKLPRLGCKQFPGRAGDWVCSERSGFNACVAYVRGSAAVHCRFPSVTAAYATADQMTAALKSQNCTVSRSAYTCATSKGKSECQWYRNGGMSVTCLSPGELAVAILPGNVYALPRPAPPETVSSGGRPRPSRTTTSQQIALVTTGTVTRGGRPGAATPIRIITATPQLFTQTSATTTVPPIRVVPFDARKENAAKALTDQGCKAGRAGDFVCSTDAAFRLCERYKGAGLAAACRLSAR
jgi:hypothetical protein